VSGRSGQDSILEGGAARWRFEVDMHPAQEQIYRDPARIKVVAAGRRFGKTVLCTADMMVTAATKPTANVMWIAPAHRQTRMAMRMIAKALPTAQREVNRTTQEIFLSTGGRMSFVSGERPDNLRGEGLDLVVIDEAAFVDESLWTQAVRPALSDRAGRALLISTFKGENWFYDLYRFAIDQANAEWNGWCFPTSANPYIPAAEIENARNELTKDEFGQEYLAIPTVFVGAVFDGDRLNAAADQGRGGVPVPPGAACEAGLDWGWNVTALEVCMESQDGRISWVDEQVYRKVELAERCEQIAAICKQYRVSTIYCDAAGATENVTLAKILERAGAPTFVQPVAFGAYKRAGIMARNWHLENGREVLGPHCTQLLADSKSYHYADDDKPAKGNDHTVDAATAFYASRAHVLGDELIREAA